MAGTSSALSSPPLIFMLKPRFHHFNNTHNSIPSLLHLHISSPSKTRLQFQNPPQRFTHLCRISTTNSYNFLLSDAAAAAATPSLVTSDPVKNAEEVVSTTITATSSDESVATIIQSLLFIAFIGLSILTIGVIYIAVTDFLQNREKDKFEKEEAAKKKKGGKKIKARPRAGPKGFGQKIDVDDDFDV